MKKLIMLFFILYGCSGGAYHKETSSHSAVIKGVVIGENFYTTDIDDVRYSILVLTEKGQVECRVSAINLSKLDMLINKGDTIIIEWSSDFQNNPYPKCNIYGHEIKRINSNNL